MLPGLCAYRVGIVPAALGLFSSLLRKELALEEGLALHSLCGLGKFLELSESWFL